MSREQERLKELVGSHELLWNKWGPYVSDRSWATVREDYSENGDAWNYFPFDLAASKAYRWGEDGIAGFCDRYQVLVFAPAFWNGNDPILKERFFGLNSNEGNHGEDVKEYYFYLDGVPTHSYMKFLYKYPHKEYPYEKLREENRKRSSQDKEYELVDTKILDGNAYFDIFITYAKESTEDFCVKIEVFNRGDEAHDLHVIPQLWFRNQWSWTSSDKKPLISLDKSHEKNVCLITDDSNLPTPASLNFDYHLGKRYFYASKEGTPLFCENETRIEGERGFFKDGIQQAIIKNEPTVNPEKQGTKAGVHYNCQKIPAKSSIILYFRLSDKDLKNPLDEIEEIFSRREKEANEFYGKLHPKNASQDEKNIQRQAWAGLIWSKQIYLFDVNVWLTGDNPDLPPPGSRYHIRNVHWRHLNSMRILLMPDKWEYPWFAAWDLAFHCVAFASIDMEFAKEQIWLLLFDQFQHPNGQIPAYEWEFSDMNPPVQGWAVLHIFEKELKEKGKGDLLFLEKCFHKLLINFAWWVNRVDASGNNIFEGGFLGLDNITVIDRSEGHGHGTLQQSDGTGWMALFSLNLMRMALYLSKASSAYESLAVKFFEHYVYIAHAMKQRECEMWSEKDGFFYDTLSYPDGTFSQFKVRSLVGVIPLYAIDILSEEEVNSFPAFQQSMDWFVKKRKDLVEHSMITLEKDGKKWHVLSIMNPDQLKSVLKYVWDKNEFHSPFGFRSLSKFHEKNPFDFEGSIVSYEPAESASKIKGGNSNWRGPIWMPANYLLIDALRKLSKAYRGRRQYSGKDSPSLDEMIDGFSLNLLSIFKKDKNGKRAFWGENFPFANSPDWQDHILFYEYFNAETGKGLGASHQTGWTALIATIIEDLYPPT